MPRKKRQKKERHGRKIDTRLIICFFGKCAVLGSQLNFVGNNTILVISMHSSKAPHTSRRHKCWSTSLFFCFFFGMLLLPRSVFVALSNDLYFPANDDQHVCILCSFYILKTVLSVSSFLITPLSRTIAILRT